MSETQGNTITLEKRDSTLIAQPQVKLMDEEQLKALARLIEESGDTGTSLVVIDLSKVAILPSLALGVLVQVSARCKSRQQRLVLAGLQRQIRQVFSITRLDRVFEFAESVDAATA